MINCRITSLVVLFLAYVAFGYAFQPNALVRSASRLAMSIPDPLDTLTSGLASLCRIPNGVTVKDDALDLPSSIQLQRLYDIENSADCRRVREKITEYDAVVDLVVPASPNSRCFLDPQSPYKVPANTIIPRLVVKESGKEKVLEGAEDIISYLDQSYSSRSKDDKPMDTKEQIVALVQQVGNYVATLLRTGRGQQVSPCAAASNSLVPRPKQPLRLYSYEGNQFCRLVREVLTELDLPYELRSAGKGSPRRAELAQVSGGSTQCPFLVDPNTNTQMPESADIIRYLYQQYALWTPPNEILQWASDAIIPAARPLFALLAPLQARASIDDNSDYEERIAAAWSQVQSQVQSAPVVVYTYDWSPFSFETKALLDNLNVTYTEVSLGAEWIPGLIQEGGSEIRAAFLDKTGQSSLPHIFIGGQSIGGLFSGTPGLLSLLEQGKLLSMIDAAKKSPSLTRP
jgi:glutaredoxin